MAYAPLPVNPYAGAGPAAYHRRVGRAYAALLVVVAALVGCDRAPSPAVPPTAPPATADRKEDDRDQVEAPESPLVVRTEDDEAFAQWLKTHNVGDFEAYLAQSGLNGVVPTRHLVRTATDSLRCGGPRFEIPPREKWPEVKLVLLLVRELRRRDILGEFEAVSNYRNPKLNACAGGARRSSHTRTFAMDILPVKGGVDERRLCEFWRKEGRSWQMGLSKYPSGRIHLDTSGWRTWGSSHKKDSAFCLAPLVP